MTNRTLRVSCVAILLLVAGLPLSPGTANCLFALPQNSDETALRTVIERYFAAYKKEDLDAMTRLWSDKSPDLAPAQAKLKDFFALNNQIETRNLTYRQIKVEGDHATALVTLEVAAVSAQNNKPALGMGKRSQNITFVKEAGEWKLQRDSSAEAELAVRLAATDSKEEREALLASADQELVTVELRKELMMQGAALVTKANYPKALDVFALAERLAEQLNDKAGLAAIWNRVAEVVFFQNDYNRTLELHEKSLALCQPLDDKACLAFALAGMGTVHLWRGDYAKANDYFRKELVVAEEFGDKAKIGIALTNLGVAQQNQGNYTQALDYHLRSQSLLESVGDKSILPAVLNRIGNINVLRGDLDLAMQYFEKSIALYTARGSKGAVANGFNNVGVVQQMRGDYGSAIKYYQKSLATNEAIGNKLSIANQYTNLGVVYRLQGNLGLSLEYHQKSLAMREAVGDKPGIATELNNLGSVYSDQGDYVRALAEQQKSLSVWQKIENKPGIARSLGNIGTVFQLQGAYDLALEQYQKALQLLEESGEKEPIVPLLNNIGMTYSLQGDHKRAGEFAERSASLAKQSGYREQYWQALSTAGNAYRALGQKDKASEAFREAISTIEDLRADIGGGEQDQQQSFEKRVSPYYRMVELLAAQGEGGEALSYAESAKSRVLLDVVRSGKVNITKAMTTEERAQEQKIRTALTSLNAQLSRENRRPQPDNTRLAQLKTELEKARLDSQDFQSRLYATHPELQIQRGEALRFRPEDSAALGADSSTALLEYAVTDDKTYLFVLTRANNNAAAVVKVYTIPVKRTELATQVGTFREWLATHNLLVREPARQAYELLLKPAQAQLRNKTQLIIVPDDVLWELPFQALLTESNHYLIEQSAISYAPSLTVLREMTARRKERPATGAGNTLLALGNPALGQETIERARSTRRDAKLDPLPEAEREVQTLGRLYGASKSEVFIGPEASEDRAKTEAGKFRVLHFATHGIVNNASPMYSHLVFSQGDSKDDGLLEAWELLNLDLRADLVVLSACETARGRVGAGEGMIGLSWALFVAGTPTVVVSQWKVDSASTTQLMLEFHRNRLAANSKAQSLRKAMLKMLGSNQYKHPFYWAPFVVIGDAN